MDKNDSFQEVEKIYQEIAEEDKRLCEDFLGVSIGTVKNLVKDLSDERRS
jgi:hypothetical protein